MSHSASLLAHLDPVAPVPALPVLASPYQPSHSKLLPSNGYLVTDPTGDAPQQLSWFLGFPHSDDTAQLPNATVTSEEVPHVQKMLGQM